MRSCLRLVLPHPRSRPTGGTRSCMTSPLARFMVCGHWPGAQPQAFLKKMEIGGPNPNHKPQTTGGPFGLTSSHSGRPKVLPPPTPTLTHWEQAPAPLQEVRPGNEFPPFPSEKAGDQESCRNLLPFYSYKSISSDPNSQPLGVPSFLKTGKSGSH